MRTFLHKSVNRRDTAKLLTNFKALRARRGGVAALTARGAVNSQSGEQFIIATGGFSRDTVVSVPATFLLLFSSPEKRRFDSFAKNTQKSPRRGLVEEVIFVKYFTETDRGNDCKIPAKPQFIYPSPLRYYYPECANELRFREKGFMLVNYSLSVITNEKFAY